MISDYFQRQLSLFLDNSDDKFKNENAKGGFAMLTLILILVFLVGILSYLYFSKQDDILLQDISLTVMVLSVLAILASLF